MKTLIDLREQLESLLVLLPADGTAQTARVRCWLQLRLQQSRFSEARISPLTDDDMVVNWDIEELPGSN